MKRALWALGLALGLLGIATILILSGQRESRTSPDSTSYGPSGTRALVELLQQSGYRVRTERGVPLRRSPNSVAIAFARVGELPELEEPTDEEEDDALSAWLRRHLADGGRVILFQVPTNFVEASRASLSNPTNVEWYDGDPYRALTNSRLGESSLWAPDVVLEPPLFARDGVYVAGTADNDVLVQFASVEASVAVFVSDALMFTNRFLDREDHAALALRVIGTTADRNSELVFLDAAHLGVERPGLTEALGPWSRGVLAQAGFLFLVIVLTLSWRFGLPTPERPRQRATRELADALAGIYRRAKATDAAMAPIVEAADRRLRRELKLSRDTTRERRDLALTVEVAEKLRQAELLTSDRAPASEAMRVVRELDAAVASVTKTSPGKVRRRPRRR